MVLAAAAYHTPLFWAVFIAWILSVVLHEFAHGIVAYRGGDYTIKERGGLTLNPLQYVDPVTSLLMPAIFLLIGGVPLPGGATYIDRDLLRSRGWDSAVSAAGPATNLLLFFACAAALHPRAGWVDPHAAPEEWTNAQILVGAMVVLQFVAVVLNLIPVPPLDGFGIIGPWMDPETRLKLSTPPTSTLLMLGLFVIVFTSGRVFLAIRELMIRVLDAIGYDGPHIQFTWRAFQIALWGRYN